MHGIIILDGTGACDDLRDRPYDADGCRGEPCIRPDIRPGAFDLAVCNLFGSNVFNMFALALVDTVYTPGRFLAAVDPAFALVGLLGLLLTAMALIGNLARLERRVLFVELDALLLIVIYLAGVYWLYASGIGM